MELRCLWLLAVVIIGGVRGNNLVLTRNGYVQGHESETRDARTIYQWLGIPYAEPPLGKLRFEPPMPVRDWSGVLNAWRYPPQCAQIHLYFESYFGQEDCLYLNVHVPKVDRNKTGILPVMFALHGGHFASGQGREIRPDYLLDQDIVLVTPNYRLSVLGFLNTGDDVVRGNMGLKDIRMALKWTYENIAKFGGDPNRITVQGFSAGGVAANLLFMVNSTREYVHRAISMSGTAINPWAVYTNPLEQAKKFANRTNCPTTDTRKMVRCFRKLNARALLTPLIGTSFLYATWDWSIDNVFVPTIETVITKDTFLSEDPEKLFKSGDFKPVPWLVGTNSNEALLALNFAFNNRTFRSQLGNRKLWPGYMEQFLSVPADRAKNADKIAQFYIGSNINVDHDAMKYVALKAPVVAIHYNKSSPLSHYDFTKGILRRMPKLIEAGIELAGLVLDHGVLRRPRVNYGVAHGDDGMMYTPFLGYASMAYRFSRDYKFSKQYIKFLTDFISDAKTLRFQGKVVPEFNLTDEFSYFIVNEEPNSGVKQVPFKNAYLFWKKFLGKKL